MGQKVNPTGFRLGTSKKQNANWYAKGKAFSENLIQDLKVREYFKVKLKNSSISKIELERSAENFVVSIFTSRPGIIIGKRGDCLLYTSPSPRDGLLSRMPSSA